MHKLYDPDNFRPVAMRVQSDGGAQELLTVFGFVNFPIHLIKGLGAKELIFVHRISRKPPVEYKAYLFPIPVIPPRPSKYDISILWAVDMPNMEIVRLYPGFYPLPSSLPTPLLRQPTMNEMLTVLGASPEFIARATITQGAAS